MRAVTFGALLAVWPVGALAAQAPADADFDRVRELVLPKPDELGFRAIPWHAELRQGLLAARQADKPVLLWAMNGHPLGCT